MAKKEDKQQAEVRLHKILDFIDKLDAQDLNNELKIRKLLVMGSTKEKKERLKKAMETSADPFNVSDPKNDPKIKKKKEASVEIKKSSIVSKIEEMNKKREERRKKMDNDKKTRQANQAQFEAEGKTGDIDFAMMIENIRSSLPKPIGHLSPEGLKIIVSVRKRPLFTKEKEAGENDCITCANPKMYIHECKLRVDGITKYVDNQSFAFDNAFSEKDETTEFYRYSIQPLIPLLYSKGTVTCFAYGQTGSGKTYTMVSVQKSAIEDLFSIQPTSMELSYSMSYFEIYGNKLYDLLNERNPLIVLEDKNQIIQIQGLSEKPAEDPEDMMKLMEKANALRTTHATTANDTSSRSHSICHILIKDKKTMKLIGKLSLVDLAGSERAQDCQSNDRVRRLEGAEINKSLLALKECIRGLDTKDAHIPFRASKLTMVLRDSFVGKSDKIRIVMIACISPGSSSSDHTLNTLRYAERLKERTNIDYEQMVN
jgi:kinesin family protein 2/24